MAVQPLRRYKPRGSAIGAEESVTPFSGADGTNPKKQALQGQKADFEVPAQRKKPVVWVKKREKEKEL